ncbi:MAG: glycosyltransferase [Thermoleophilia bacterium]|nr:glycosyltransferase [Thermoleophilia bacterium]
MLAAGLAGEGVESVGGRPGRRQPWPILLAWVRAGRPRVLHLHWTHEYLKGAAGPTRVGRWRFMSQLRLLRRLGVRIVWTMHNLGGHDGSRHPSEMAVHRELVGLADAVICHCSAAREAAIAAYGLGPAEAAKLHVVPHGSYVGAYPDGLAKAEARVRLGLPADGPVLLFLGAVRGYKGTDELVAAFRAIEDPSARLLIAGRPRGAGIEERLAGAAAIDRRIVVALRFIEDAELQVWLRAADLVVLPFRDILTSGRAILALSFGRPVVAPALGCLPETVPPTAGVLYDPAAPDALSGALRTALSGDLAAMGAAARARAEALDWGPIAAATAALYRGGPPRR